MRRLCAGLLGTALVLAAVLLARAPRPLTANPTDTPSPSAALRVAQEPRNPWNHLKINNDPSTFRFAIVTDNTGGARAGVFARAVEQLNWLQPEFVVSVGDYIEGKTEDLDQINREWQEFNGWIAKLQMPFFYVPGNHDISNKVMEKRWQEMFGRRHYHFVYKDVVFLFLNTEDTPKTKTGKFNVEQVAYVKQTLAENRGARWTLVFLHRPTWTHKEVGKTGWLEIEKLLAGRRYTVFAGHEHIYERSVRHGQRYYILATTGGASKLRGVPLGEFDHLVWVTMKKDGPVLANLMMEGIFPDDLRMVRAGKTAE